MRRWVYVTAVLVGLCATSPAQEPILQAMVAQSVIVAHVTVLDVNGPRIREPGILLWDALCEVMNPIKGNIQKGSRIRVHISRAHLPGGKPLPPMMTDRQYVVFLRRGIGSMGFRTDTKLEPVYELVDRWLGVLSYDDRLVRRLRELQVPRPDIAQKIQEATSPKTPHAVRFAAVRALAISPYTVESANALAQVACDAKVGETTRIYAAMGLSNFTNHLPEDLKSAIRKKLRGALAREGPDTPDGIIRTLLAWGDAAYIREILGNRLAGHSMEIDVLAALPGEWASERLWQLYLSCPRGRKAEHYSLRAKVGRALARREDKRGIDILMELLPAENAPAPQYRSNVYNFLALTLRRDFGYKGGNYRPELEQAIPKIIDWWKNNRHTFAFRERPEPLD